MTDRSGEPVVVLTVGHSNRPLDAFLNVLIAHRVELVCDVRTVPRSRHNPQSDRDELPASLKAAGISYAHLSGLGGLRRPRKDSTNLGWRNSSFRGYADYMQTEEFERNLEALLELARRRRTAVMCAEAVPWRCHRSLISDALVVRGVRVEHLLGAGRSQEHELTAWARIEGERVSYPPPLGGIEGS